MFQNNALILKGIGAALLGACLFGFSPAHAADSGSGGITNSAPKPWIVLSNGQSYTTFNHLGMVSVAGNLQYDTGTAGRVKSWWAEPHIVNGYGIATPVAGLGAYKQSHSYPLGSRPKTINKNLVFSIPAVKFANAAVGMCNWLADSLRNQGKSNQEIFSVNREVSFKASLNYDVEASGAGSGSPIWEATADYIIPVRCSKWSGPQVPAVGGITTPFHVIKATMQKQMIVTLGGTCQVKLTTAINTNKANAEIKFRYKSQSGKQSQVFTTKTAANKIAVVTHTWNITNTPSVFDGTWIHMDGVSPDFKSNTVSAFAECKEGGPTGLAPTPKKPTVVVPLGGNGTLRN